MDFPALAQRVIYPRTHTMDAAWTAAANSGYAGRDHGYKPSAVGRALALDDRSPSARRLVQLAFGFVYIVLAVVAFRRSRVASIAILALIIFEILVEIVFGLGLRPSQLILLTALVLAIGGLREVLTPSSHIFDRRNPARRAARGAEHGAPAHLLPTQLVSPGSFGFFNICQCSPAAATQDIPSGWVMRIVQLPLSDVSTSITKPVEASPTATGCSPKPLIEFGDQAGAGLTVRLSMDGINRPTNCGGQQCQREKNRKADSFDANLTSA